MGWPNSVRGFRARVGPLSHSFRALRQRTIHEPMVTNSVRWVDAPTETHRHSEGLENHSLVLDKDWVSTDTMFGKREWNVPQTGSLDALRMRSPISSWGTGMWDVREAGSRWEAGKILEIMVYLRDLWFRKIELLHTSPTALVSE
jgi:hypothetical protein